MSWFDASDYFVLERLAHDRRLIGAVGEPAAPAREDVPVEDIKHGRADARQPPPRQASRAA